MKTLGRLEGTNRRSIYLTRPEQTGSALDQLYPSLCAAASQQALHRAEIGGPLDVVKFDMLTARDGDARLQFNSNGSC